MSAAAGASLRIRVVPRAARNAISRDAHGVLRVHVTAPPVEGAANRAVVALLADRLDLPKGAVAIARGAHGRDKTVLVMGLSPTTLEARIAAVLGSSVDKARRHG